MGTDRDAPISGAEAVRLYEENLKRLSRKRPKSEVRQRAKILGFRVTRNEERVISDAAERRGLSVASFLREAAMREAVN